MFTSRSREPQPPERARELVRDRGADEAFQHDPNRRQGSSTCDSAYRHWVSTANSSDRGLAFATSTAAVDRGMHAAVQYEASALGAWNGCGS